MAKTHKIMKGVKSNPLSEGRGADHIAEMERIRRFANMESSIAEDHFDSQTYQFDSSSNIQPDMKKKRPYSKGTSGEERDDTGVSLQRTVSFPVRKKLQK